MSNLKTNLREKTNDELVSYFNNQVNSSAWTSSKAIFLSELKKEFKNRAIDLSEVLNSTGGFNLNQKVKLTNLKLSIV